MSNAQAERAINQLYESDSLRSELRDEEASLLLMWGEVRLNELAQRDLPDSQFDDVSSQFRSLLAAINVCVGKRKTSPSQHLSMMASISSAADASGFMLTPDDQTTFLKHQGALTNQDAISELLGLLKPAAIPTPSHTIAEAAAEMVPPEPEPQNIVAAAAETVMPEPPAPIENYPQPPSQEAPAGFQPPPQTISENQTEIITPQNAPEVVDQTLPPQPEDLPELPPQLPQEGQHDV